MNSFQVQSPPFHPDVSQDEQTRGVKRTIDPTPQQRCDRYVRLGHGQCKWNARTTLTSTGRHKPSPAQRAHVGSRLV